MLLLIMLCLTHKISDTLGVGGRRQQPLPTPDPSLGRGKKAWLFVGCELAGKRAATVMSLVHSANQHGHGPWLYLTDVLERLPMHPNHRIDELLPHR